MATKPLQHTQRQIAAAAKVAQKLGVSVRLEKNGDIVIVPGKMEPEALDTTSPQVGGSALQAWRNRRHAGKAHGRA